MIFDKRLNEQTSTTFKKNRTHSTGKIGNDPFFFKEHMSGHHLAGGILFRLVLSATNNRDKPGLSENRHQ